MIYLFDKDEQLIKLIRKDVIKTAQQKFELKDGYVSDRLTVEMRMLSDDDLQKVEYMAIQSINDTHDFHYFWVAQKNNTDNITTLVGVQSGIEELQKTVVYDQRPKDQLAKPVIDRLLEGSNWRARFIGGNQTRSTNFYYISTFEALKKICSVWGLEMQFFIEMNGNKIGARYIDFKEHIGKAIGSRVVYGHNALQILQEVERTNIYTALIGRGKGEETENGGFGRKLTFEDIEWTTPVEKPKGQQYVEIPSMTELYGIKNADGTMRPKIGTVDFQDETDANNLLKLTYEQLVNVSRPQVTFKTSTAYISNAEIGDTVRVVRHDKHIDYETRIFEITFNRLNDESADIKLGDNIKGESEKRRIQSVVNESLDGFVENELKPAFEKLPEFLATADGKNTNWYSDEDPTVQYPGKVLINDVWYKPDPEFEGEKIMLRWTGEVWEEILRTSDPDRIKRSIDQQFEEFNTSYDEAKALQDKQIADVLEKAGTAEDLAKEAKTDAASAITQALQSKDEAIADANRLIEENKDYTDGLFVEVNNVFQYLSEELSSKISRMDFDSLRKTVNQQETTLNQQAEQIFLKADKTVTDALAMAVNQTKSELKITSDAVATKVSKTDFDATNQRLTTAETTIRTQAGQIETKLSRTDADKIVTNAITQSEQGTIQRISEVEGKIPTEAGGVNLLLNSDFSKSTKGDSFTVDGQVYDTTATNWGTYNGGIANAKTSYHAYVADYAGRKNAVVYNESNGSRNWKAIHQSLGSRMPQTTNNFILSLDVFVSGAGTKLFGGFYYADKSGSYNFYSDYFRFDTSSFEIGKWQRVNVAVPFEKEKADFTKDIRFYIYAYNFSTNAILAIDDVKLETGKIATGHSLASEEFATTAAVHEIRQTVDSYSRTISEQGKSISQVVQTAQGLVSRVDNLKSGSRNYLLNSKLTTTDMTGISDTGPLDVPINISFDFWKHDDVYKSQKIRLSLYYQSSVAYSSSRTFPVYFRKVPYYQIGTITYPSGTSKLMKFEFTFGTMPSGFDATQIFIRFDRSLDRGRVHTIERAHLEVSDMFSDWSPAPEDSDAAIEAVSTQVSQLAGSWAVQNLTSAGTVLNQLNLNKDGSVKIDGRLVQITGTTYIQDGVITSAKIADLDAGKIKTGTLDAAQVNLINLNANKVVGLDADFIKAKIEHAIVDWLEGKVIRAQNGAMTIDLLNGYTSLNSNYSGIFRVEDNASDMGMMFVNVPLTTDDGIQRVNSKAIIGAERRGNDIKNNWNKGGFNGIIIDTVPFIGTTDNDKADLVTVVGDTVRLTHTYQTDGSSYYDKPTGWEFKNYAPTTNAYTSAGKVSLMPININPRQSSIFVGDIKIMDDENTGFWLRNFLGYFNQIMLHLGNHTDRKDIFKPFNY